MFQDDIMNKTILYINNNNATMSNDKSFSYNLLESIKDVACIKIIKSEIILIPSNGLGTNNNLPQSGDPIFVKMNDFKRISSVINGNNVKFFDVITLNVSDKNANVLQHSFANNSSSTFNINDPSVHIFNPVESNITTLKFELYDKHNNILEVGDDKQIKSFSIILCIYDYKRKLSQY